jgi:hypothetical protein
MSNRQPADIDVHVLDHRPFSRECRHSNDGGGWLHLKLTWEYRRRAQVLRWPRRFLCRWGWHKPNLFLTGHMINKDCLRCRLPLPLNAEELATYLDPAWRRSLFEPRDQEKPRDQT